MLLWIQVIGILFALDMVFVTYLYYRRRVFRLHDAIIWNAVWLGLLLAVLFPSYLEIVVESLKVVRVMDFLIIAGFFLSFGLLFTVFIRIRYAEDRLEKVVRELTYLEAEDVNPGDKRRP